MLTFSALPHSLVLKAHSPSAEFTIDDRLSTKYGAFGLAVDTLEPPVTAAADVATPALHPPAPRVWPAATVASLVTVLVWGAAFAIRLATVPATWWQWRDDAVITLSHSMNWVEFGTFGVSAGDRSEGFSSPLHGLVAAMLYAVAPLGYESTTLVLLAVSVTVSAVAAAVSVFAAARSTGMAPRRAATASALLAGGAGIVVASSWSSVGWIASGMENALVVACALGSTALALTIRGRFWGVAALIVMLTALGVSRVEFVAMSGPAVLAAAWVVSGRVSSHRRLLSALIIGIPVVVWAGIHATRWIYFGSLYPTSALAQDKSVTWVTFAWLALAGALWLLLSAAATTTRGLTALRAMPWAIVALATSVLAVDGLWNSVVVTSSRLVTLLALGAGASWLVLARVVSQRVWRADALFAALALIPIVQYLAMGPARMDSMRVLFLAVPVLALWCAAGLAVLLPKRWAGEIRVPLVSETVAVTSRSAQVLAGAALSLGLVASVAAPVAALTGDATGKLGWDISPASMLDGVNDFTELKLPAGALPIGANPDLGKVSFAKSAQIVDLGWLGEPLLARLNEQRIDLRDVYLARVLRPDVMQTQGPWSCEYGQWLISGDFSTDYAIVSSQPNYDPKFDQCPYEGRLSVWHRRDSAELELTALISASANPALVVREALDECRIEPTGAVGDPFRCAPVLRSVWRLTPALQESGKFDEVVAEFRRSPTAALDQLLLTRPSGWGQQAFDEFTAAADAFIADEPTAWESWGLQPPPTDAQR